MADFFHVTPPGAEVCRDQLPIVGEERQENSSQLMQILFWL